MRYEHILAAVLSMPWAITHDYLSIIVDVLARRIAGRPLTDDEIAVRVSAGQLRAVTRSSGARVGAIAVMPVIGVLLPRGEAMDTSGAVSTQHLAAQFDQLVADESIAAVVLDVDSPGGSVGGVAEFAARVHDAREKKPIVAIANPTMASAAYWIGSNASELVASPSALVGSIGVYSAHEDLSAMLEKEGVKITLIAAGANKTLGNPFEPLSAEGRAEIQGRVDVFEDLFVRAVARGRGVSQRTVREQFGQGSVFGSAEAVKLGMADRVGTLDSAISSAAKRAGVRPRTAAEEPATAPLSAVSDSSDFRLRMAELGL